MTTAAPDLPAIEDRTAFNLKRWEELCRDPVLASLEYRIETDAFGRIVMTPPPSPEHGEAQSRLAILLDRHLSEGRVITECPVSTNGGVRAVDVAWISLERRRDQRGQPVLTRAPEICIEVLSPTNTRAEIEEKKRLYFEAGAEEVWTCGLDGTLRVFLRSDPASMASSALAPEFPVEIDVE